MEAPIVHQSGLFDDASRWPKRPYCTDDLASGLRIRSLRQAMTQPYIQANPPHLRVWSIHDVDRPGAALAWESCNLPPPTWAAVNRISAHAHLVWGLSAPVLVDGLHAKDAPMRYLCAVESLMRERMQADEGFSGLITKNPEHPLWRTYRGPAPSYDLGYLAEHLPDIEKHRPRRGVNPARIGLGRNCTLFDALRLWAYIDVRRFRDAKGLCAWNEFMAGVQVRALVLNCDLFASRALDPREVYHIAKSVGKWTWRRVREAIAKSDRRFSELQSYRAKQNSKARLFKNAPDA